MRPFLLYTVRSMYIFARPLLNFYFSFRKSKRVRVAIHSGDKLLLVKTTFSSQKPALPGGGVGRGEKPEETAVREVYEETGIKLRIDQLKYVGAFTLSKPNLPFHITLYSAGVESTTLPPLSTIHQFEIFERSWHSIDSLEPTDPVLKWYLNRDQLC